ncbi:IS1 family transposase [Serratia symbiotica]
MTNANIHCPRCEFALVYRPDQSPKATDKWRKYQ